ncbi:MAG: DoxX family protein [Candidatus Neomarinimicrobiota bacterium]
MTAKRTLLLALLLRVSLGLFWLDHGWDKLSGGWLTENMLAARMERSNTDADGAVKVYLERFAIPASGVLRFIVTAGELAVGVAFLAGFWMKPASWGAVFMVLNFKFADGRLGLLGSLGDAYLYPLLLAALTVAYLDLGREWTIKRALPRLKAYDI